MGIRIREATSGKEIVGTVTGQILTWNQTTQRWDVSSAPGGGGPSWFSTMWVNADAASFVGADGTPGKPFATIQAAHDALPASGGTIIVVPAAIAGYPALLTFDRPINLVALMIGTMGGLTNAVEGIALGSDVNTDSFLSAFGFDAVNWISTTIMVCKGCSGTWNVDGALILEDCLTSNPTSCSELHAQTSTLTGNILCTNAVCDMASCVLDGGASIEFVGAAGDARIDAMTNYYFIQTGMAIVNGTKTLLFDDTP